MSHFKYMADCTDRQTETDSDIELTIVFSAALYFVCHTIVSPATYLKISSLCEDTRYATACQG